MVSTFSPSIQLIRLYRFLPVIIVLLTDTALRRLDDRFGGNGALSLRRVSGVKQVLRFQSRLNDSDPSDRWLSMRMGLLPDAKMAPASKEAEFSVENVWHDKPMGYRADTILPDSVWGDSDKRKQIYQYCPEVKIIHEMKLERQRCQTS